MDYSFGLGSCGHVDNNKRTHKQVMGWIETHTHNAVTLVVILKVTLMVAQTV